ncbi:hypothetical protein AA11825_1087 [Acetobacter pomorum DSM 11825]|nr:hypothetical protein AA11825_1087 [Acetobacter pomorum DSM 11825]
MSAVLCWPQRFEHKPALLLGAIWKRHPLAEIGPFPQLLLLHAALKEELRERPCAMVHNIGPFVQKLLVVPVALEAPVERVPLAARLALAQYGAELVEVVFV